MQAIAPVIRDKLVRLFGEEEARSLAAETLESIGLEAVETANDIYRFGDALTARGGVYAVLGHSIKTHAILRGALTGPARAAGARR
ncbi:MAG: hypothetical protein R3B09_01210 [Nannocystaceae bacterium]